MAPQDERLNLGNNFCRSAPMVDQCVIQTNEGRRNSLNWEKRVERLPQEYSMLVKLIFDEFDLRMLGYKTITPAAMARKNARSIVDSTFVDQIRNAKNPPKLKAPLLLIFKGNSKPQSHLTTYQ